MALPEIRLPRHSDIAVGEEPTLLGFDYLTYEIPFRNVYGLRCPFSHFADGCKVIKSSPLPTQDLHHALINRLLGKEPVHLQTSRLPHSVRSSDGLPFDCGLHLRFSDDNDRGRLNV